MPASTTGTRNPPSYMNMNDQAPSGNEPKLPQLRETVSAEASKLKEKLSGEAEATGGKIKEEAKSAVVKFKEAGKQFASDQKNALSQKADEFAQALGAASERLKDNEEPNMLAGPADDLSRQLGKLSKYLSDSGPEEIMHGVSDLAKRKPELFFGGLFLAGLIGARFLKASSRRSPSTPKSDSSQDHVLSGDFPRKIQTPALQNSTSFPNE